MNRATGGRPAASDPGALARTFDAMRSANEVPGASAGISVDGCVELFSAGHTVAGGNAPVTPETIFQIGSLTKLYSATLLAHVADRHRIELDQPIDTWAGDELPVFLHGLTIRTLLSHASGLDADVGLEYEYGDGFGRGDDCLRRYIDALTPEVRRGTAQPVYSYSNTGFALAGWLTAQLAGTTWDRSLRNELLAPLGAAMTLTLPEEALLHPFAFGHTQTKGTITPTKQWQVTRALAPAGGILSTPADVLRLLELHLRRGRDMRGEQLLSPALVDEMAKPQVSVGIAGIDSFGLGWWLSNWSGHPVLLHQGDTLGHEAICACIPTKCLAVAVLANATTATRFLRDTVGLLLRDYGIEPDFADQPEPESATPHKLSAFLGTYSRANVELDVTQEGERLRLTKRVSRDLARLWSMPRVQTSLMSHDRGMRFRSDRPTDSTPADFSQLVTGKTNCLHLDLRAHVRTN